MSRDVIFKTFRTYKHPYVYDRHTNSLVMLTEDEYSELSQVEKGEVLFDQSLVLSRFQEFGMFKPNVVEKIEHPGTAIIERQIKTRMKQLILQITQQCNLRCEYCAYSGLYDGNRTHSDRRMTLETATKAIDFFLERNGELSDVAISFYGGEPLLEIDLIKESVEYAKNKTEGKRIRFNITTNGTLLSDGLVDYLVENNFGLSISLDGSKEEHDVNRKYLNGKGSFDTIIDNIKRIHKRHPEYGRQISIMTTINPYMDLSCSLEFFSTEEIFSDKTIIFNSMKYKDLKQELTYDEKYFRVRNYEYIKMLFSLVGKLDVTYVSPLVISSRKTVEQRQKRLKENEELCPVTHHGGPCMPGVRRLFVRVDGTLFPCERVNEALEYYKIGTLEEGLNIDQMRKLLNNGKLTESSCKKCWNLRNCSICAAELEFETEPSRTAKLKECPQINSKVIFDLYELCVLNEFGLDFEEMRVR